MRPPPPPSPAVGANASVVRGLKETPTESGISTALVSREYSCAKRRPAPLSSASVVVVGFLGFFFPPLLGVPSKRSRGLILSFEFHKPGLLERARLPRSSLGKNFAPRTSGVRRTRDPLLRPHSFQPFTPFQSAANAGKSSAWVDEPRLRGALLLDPPRSPRPQQTRWPSIVSPQCDLPQFTGASRSARGSNAAS